MGAGKWVIYGPFKNQIGLECKVIYIIILVARLFVCVFVRELLRGLLADLLHFLGKCSANTQV